MSDDSESASESSSYDSDSSCERPSERKWTCDDIYPTKGKPKSNDKDDSSSSYDSSDPEDESDSDDSFAATKPSPTSGTCTESSESSSDGAGCSKTKKDEPVRGVIKRHSSAEIEAALNVQSEAIRKATEDEEMRRAEIQASRERLKEQTKSLMDLSAHMDKELEEMNREYDSSEDTMADLRKKAEEMRGIKEQASKKALADKLERRNLEREMRLAKARERIEKKKDEEAAKKEIERQKLKEASSGNFDMSKAARIERAYSWYTRMAMPTREKMKERVQFMPASSGVTPDDVDLLPWNARGSFVSVAAMMKMNRTCSSSSSNFQKTKSGDDSDSD